MKRKHGKRFNTDITAKWAIALLCGAIGYVLGITGVHADGGTVQFAKLGGPFSITVFTTPSPLRAGPVDISLMIQSSDNQQPLLDCVAELQLRKEGEVTINSEATHGAAQNKLFYGAQVRIPESGVWDLEAIIRRGDDSAKVSGSITLAPSDPVLLAYWRSLAIPPLFISLFALNQWLKRRRAAPA